MKSSINKIGFYFLVLVIFFLNKNVDAQSVPNLKDNNAVTNAFGNDYLYFTSAIDYKGKTSSQQLRLELESQLKTGLAKQIISKIKVINKPFIIMYTI